jgi:hypothetical protein
VIPKIPILRRRLTAQSIRPLGAGAANVSGVLEHFAFDAASIHTLEATRADLVLTARTPAVVRSYTLPATRAAFVLTARTPTVIHGSGIVEATRAPFVLTARTATLILGTGILTATRAPFVLTARTPTVIHVFVPHGVVLTDRSPRADDAAAELGYGLDPWGGEDYIRGRLTTIASGDPVSPSSIFVRADGEDLDVTLSAIVDGYDFAAYFPFPLGATTEVEVEAATGATLGTPEVWTWSVTTRPQPAPRVAGVTLSGVIPATSAWPVRVEGTIPKVATWAVRVEGSTGVAGIYGTYPVRVEGAVLQAFDSLRTTPVRFFGRVAIERILMALSAAGVIGHEEANQGTAASGIVGNPDAVFAAFAASATVPGESVFPAVTAAALILDEHLQSVAAGGVVGHTQFDQSVQASGIVDGRAAELSIVLTAKSDLEAE